MTNRLIDADKIADYVCDKCGADNCDRNPTYCVERDFIVACAKEMPEAIVRCKDCKWYKISHLKRDGTENKRYKPSVCVVGEYAQRRREDWYCADGERREDADA